MSDTVKYNLKNDESNLMNNVELSFSKQNELFDKSIDNLISNYNLYGRYRDVNDKNLNNTFTNFSTNDETIKNNHLDLLNENKNIQKSLLNSIHKRSDNLKKNYDYTSDMYRNQKFMNDYTKTEYNTLKRRNKHLTEDLDKNLKKNQIYNYYYKKNKSQLSILYNLILVVVFLIILTFLNNHVKFIMNDILYGIIVGVIIALFSIYIFYQLFDLLMRDNINFDEYSFLSVPLSDPVKQKSKLITKNNDNKCIAALKSTYSFNNDTTTP